MSLTTPNQWASCSGFVMASQTRWRGAGKTMVRSIRSERVIGSPLMRAQDALVCCSIGNSQVAYREYTRKNHNKQPQSCVFCTWGQTHANRRSGGRGPLDAALFCHGGHEIMRGKTHVKP